MAKPTKRELKITIPGLLSTETFEGDLKEVMERIKMLPLDAIATGNPHIPLCHRFYIEEDYDYDFDDHRTTTYTLIGYRWETDIEFEKRVAQEKAAAAAAKRKVKQDALNKEKKERELYEKLKAKFE